MIKKELQQELNRTKLVLDYAKQEIKEKDKEIERLNNIIKEVREYIENNWINQKDADIHRFDTEELEIEISDIAVLYDILDKVGSDKE